MLIYFQTSKKKKEIIGGLESVLLELLKVSSSPVKFLDVGGQKIFLNINFYALYIFFFTFLYRKE